FWKHLDEIHALWTQFGKNQDKICNSTRRCSRFCYQTVETSSQSLVTPSEHSRDDVKIFYGAVKVTDSMEARKRFTG
ncbi:hypothetical protein Tco_0781972, partial [Tanacetum coccineum]